MGSEGAFLADSCGTADYHIGQQPDPRTIHSAVKNGISIDHACRQLNLQDLHAYDYVLAMDQANLRHISRLSAGKFDHKIFKMRYFDPEAQDADVPDPYYGNEADFQEVFEILDRSVAGLLGHLRGELD